MKANKSTRKGGAELDTLARHELMYMRRLAESSWRRGLSEKEILDIINSPRTFRHSRRVRPAHKEAPAA